MARGGTGGWLQACTHVYCAVCMYAEQAWLWQHFDSGSGGSAVKASYNGLSQLQLWVQQHSCFGCGSG